MFSISSEQSIKTVNQQQTKNEGDRCCKDTRIEAKQTNLPQMSLKWQNQGHYHGLQVHRHSPEKFHVYGGCKEEREIAQNRMQLRMNSHSRKITCRLPFIQKLLWSQVPWAHEIMMPMIKRRVWRSWVAATGGDATGVRGQQLETGAGCPGEEEERNINSFWASEGEHLDHILTTRLHGQLIASLWTPLVLLWRCHYHERNIL